jgi:hypothetical protein
MQFLIVDYNADVLYNDVSGVHWQELIDNKQENYYENDDDDDDEEEEGQDRRLHDVVQVNASPRPFFDDALRLYHSKSTDDKEGRRPPFAWSATLDRRLQQVSNTGVLEGCDTTLYTSGRLFDEERLWPIWRLTAPAAPGSFFQAHVFEELCEQEALTQQYLAENNLCFGCDSDQKCLPPYSLVLYARLVVENGMTMDCQELAQNWEAYEMEGQDELVECVVDLKADYNPERDGQDFPASCPQGFSPMMLDELYDETNRIQFTSSVFATTYDDIDELYDAVDNYARGEEHVSGAYDTQDEDFVNLSLDAQLGVDMSLALASAFVTTIAMIVHTRSLFLALTGLLQVTLSFPLAFGAYRFMGSIEFFRTCQQTVWNMMEVLFRTNTCPDCHFPVQKSAFLNFIGVFVLFALGADDVFVAVDKWKNARLRKPSASVQEIAKIAFPDAAMAMLLTTATTSVAFFGTAICPVAPIRCFAIFVGIMIILDYMLCILLVFPALVIYDNRRDKPSCWSRCCSCFSCCGPKEFSDEDIDEAVQPSSKQSLPNDAVEEIDEEANLIRRIFGRYYTVLHAIRWPLLVACIVAFVLTAIKAASLDLPTSSDVRLYNENDNQYEQNFVWRQNLLYDALYKKGGSTAYVVWGLTPADNGDRNDPTEWSSLVLDDSFEASDTDSQAFLRDFCDKFFSNVFAGLVDSDYVCPINRFDEWLQEQSISTAPDSVYQDFCGGASSLPMDPSTFDACISGWADMENETTVLSRQGKVEVMYIKFNSRVRYDSPYEDLDDEWHAIEDYMDSLDAPPTALNGYFTSEDFWWYDTNGSMLETAYSSSAIAMGAAAGAILLSSRSIVLTFFSTLTVGYVLTSVTATLVAMGWTLGFLEAILFAILIGISWCVNFCPARTWSRVVGSLRITDLFWFPSRRQQ